MLPIYSVEQVRKADAYTISNEPVASVDLMERAALACRDWILRKCGERRPNVVVLCGPGNNGGDGLAIARLLAAEGFKPMVFIPEDASLYSEDFSVNLERLSNAGVNRGSFSELKDTVPATDSLIIDALFGSGLNKEVGGELEEVIRWINDADGIIISVDIPSGLFADKPSGVLNAAIVNADYTLSFQFPKLSFFFAENDRFVGSWEVLPIGIHPDFTRSETGKHVMIEEADIRGILHARKKFSHKGNYGHALLISGSLGKMGAAILASRACLRSGVGLLTTHVPGCGYSIIQTAVPEAMASVSGSENECSDLPSLDPYRAVGIGPGLGTGDEARNVMRLLIQEARVPMILDADALNILSNHKTWLAFLPPGSILTPHPGEFERLAGKAPDSFQRLDQLKDFCSKNRLYVVLKGAHSITCTPDGTCYFNNTGNPGMATGGSGDVLTGIILGLLAQGYSQLSACIVAVHLHGYAGDLAAIETGYTSLIAGDIIEKLGESFKVHE